MTALRVLVVEDDAMIGMLLAEMLGDMGYNVCAIAATEDDAVVSAVRCKPGLLIVDEQLREGTGAAAVDRILRTGPIPCVFISGASVPPSRPDAHVLRKPFLEDDLVRAIQEVVDRSNAPATHLPGSPHLVLGHGKTA
jgi:CheY-like chemotaxis protein